MKRTESFRPRASRRPSIARLSNGHVSLLLAGGVLAAIAISCGTLTRTVMAPPAIPGATFIGDAGCAECHDELVRHFTTASHARLTARGPNAAPAGCESCHGPGSLHSESGGEVHLIINPEKSPSVCFDCHLDVRGSFNLPHHHPVPERLTCTDCHDPHKGDAIMGGGTALLSQNEACLQCHSAQRGPHVFEHEAMREGCTSCHLPHGSVNARMLAQRNAPLCLKCHFQEQRAAGSVLIGGFDHTTFLQQGTCWSAGCHEAVHGSQVSSSLRF
jgi:predicted CXXCH cytochrome family protein